MLTGLYWLVYVNFTQTRVTQEEGISIELLLPPVWPVGRFLLEKFLDH